MLAHVSIRTRLVWLPINTEFYFCCSMEGLKKSTKRFNDHQLSTSNLSTSRETKIKSERIIESMFVSLHESVGS